MVVNEREMLNILDNSKNTFLLEPNYKRKYPPLGLLKIGSYLDNVEWGREYKNKNHDLVCITSLFTFNLRYILDAINQIRTINNKATILIGGICASLIPNNFPEDVFIFKGYSKILDQCVPDYRKFEWGVEEKWQKFSFTFTSRGCPNKCPYCAVWRIEPEHQIVSNWREHIVSYMPYAMISDNNLSATKMEHIENIVIFLSENKKRVTFDNGFDCKLVTEEMAKLLSLCKYNRSGLRFAFDRIGEDGIFQEAIKKVLKNKVAKDKIMAYVLFNFNDTPKEANYRMSECVKLGIRPYPQQYEPLNIIDRDNRFIGKYWTKNLLKVFRTFWLFAGYYTKISFEDYAKSSKNNIILTKEDWNCWMTGEAGQEKKLQMDIF